MLQIPNDPYRVLTIGASRSGKTIFFLKFINHQSDIDELYIYAKDLYELKYQVLINKPEKIGE